MIVGLVIGEMPGPSHDVGRPLDLTTATGRRLLALSGLAIGEYLQLGRLNLQATHGWWDRARARRRALELLEWAATMRARRVVLLGSRVAAAFGLTPWGRSSVDVHGRASSRVELVAIPHPSGRCRTYNEAWARRGASVALRWAAGRRASLRGLPSPRSRS